MKHFSLGEVMGMEKIPRLNFINSLTGFKSANLIGTTSSNGQENLAIFSSVVHMGSKPPYVGMTLRPTTVPRHTYANIKETGYYTINHVAVDFIAGAHQTSASYSENISEFEECGFQSEYLGGFQAPFVKQCAIKYGVVFKEEHHIKANDTLLIVGAIQDIWLPESLIADDGFIDIEKAGTATISGLDRYHQTQGLDRFKYARVPK